MPKHPRKVGPLTEAAIQLEDDLCDFEEAVADAARVRLDTRGNLERCGRDIQRAAGLFTSMQERTTAFGARLGEAQSRALAAGTRLQEVGEELARRQERYVERAGAFGQLLEEASAVGDLASQGPDAVGALRDRIAALVVRAGELADAAREAGFRDLAAEATGRRQQLEALARKLDTVA